MCYKLIPKEWCSFMLAKCLGYIVFVSCWGCYKCSMYYNYMHLGHFSLLFLMLSCTENWASVSEWRQSQLLSLKPLFKVCKSQQIFKNLSISLKIYSEIMMPVETKKVNGAGWLWRATCTSCPFPHCRGCSAMLCLHQPVPLSRDCGILSRAFCSTCSSGALLQGKQFLFVL